METLYKLEVIPNKNTRSTGRQHVKITQLGSKVTRYTWKDENELEYISIDVIAEDPTELVDCFDPNADFPIPGAMIPTITQMILERELRTLVQMPSDTTNDSKDNTQNIYSR